MQKEGLKTVRSACKISNFFRFVKIRFDRVVSFKNMLPYLPKNDTTLDHLFVFQLVN